jgi:hypothetical protein
MAADICSGVNSGSPQQEVAKFVPSMSGPPQQHAIGPDPEAMVPPLANFP